ncbi:MAG: hypothetical protein WC728_04560 [Elusimicrobiota bacterium]
MSTRRCSHPAGSKAATVSRPRGGWMYFRPAARYALAKFQKLNSGDPG